MRTATMCTLGLAAITAAALSAQASAYRVTHTYVLGGDGSWDYIVPDPPNHRLFIARQTRLMVVDENSGQLIGEVTGINGAHGTAIAAATGHGFATSGNDQSVVMFDLTTLQPLGRVHAAEDADAIVLDGPSNRVFTLNGDAHSSTVIDPRQGTLITNIPLGGKPEYGASAGDGNVYANLTDTNEVVEIDAATATVTRRWPTAPCRQPVAMAIDTAHHRLFSGCRSGVMAVSDYKNARVVTTLPIGTGVDGSGFDPASGDAFASNADGTLTVIHQDDPDRYHVVENVPTAPAARNMGLDPLTHRIFVVSAAFGPAPAGGRGRGPVLSDSFKLLVIERAASGKTLAQRLVETAHIAHPDIDELGISTTTAKGCVGVASTDASDIGEACEAADLKAMQTGKPVAESEAGGFDVSVPLRDVHGNAVGIVGVGLKAAAGLTAARATAKAQAIATEMASQIPSKAALLAKE